MSIRGDLGDALDDSLEMPESYRSRAYWRYYQVSGLIGLASLPILISLSFVDGSTWFGQIAWIVGLVLIAAVAIFLVRRDIIVQRRIDRNGSPLAEREPY